MLTRHWQPCGARDLLADLRGQATGWQKESELAANLVEEHRIVVKRAWVALQKNLLYDLLVSKLLIPAGHLTDGNRARKAS